MTTRTVLSVKPETKAKLSTYLDLYEKETGLRITAVSFFDQAISEKIERDTIKFKK
jgi:hypothetical protein